MVENMKWVRYGLRETTSKGRRECMDSCRIDVSEELGASVSILHKVMADQLGMKKIEPSSECFTFVDLSERSSGGIIRDLEVQIGNALVPVDFQVLNIKLN
ncbi:hypothetical protein F2Q69_00030662 [Brassica cretica]|uniref:Uncharacterized protein n=1 Tax=Brassica cretica TaxID=69181 RepID=A0A8S9RUW1_BRACR|nr:hypothetical protein F2Q69_00030662 [Brassica cretica]